MQSVVEFTQVFSFMWRLGLAFRRSFAIRMLCGLVWACVTSIQPYLLKEMINRLAGCGRGEIFAVMLIPGLWYLSSYFILSLSFMLQAYAVDVQMKPYLRKKIAKEAVQSLLGRPFQFFQDHFSGALVNRINNLTRATPDLFDLLDRFYSHFLAFLIALGFLWSVSPFFALVTLSWSACFFICLYAYSFRLSYFSKLWAKCGSELTGQYVDLLSNVLSVRLFSSEKSEKKFIYQVMDKAVKSEKKMQKTYFQMWAIFDLSFFLLQVVNVYLLCLGVRDGWLSPGDFALVLVLNGSLCQVLYRLSREFSKFSEVHGQIVQALFVVGTSPLCLEANKSKIKTNLQVEKGGILFDKVVFFYKDGERLFNNKSVEILPGQKVGLVGYSGAGKSTFVNLILGLYELNEGRILIDGQDIASVSRLSLCESIGMIPQDPSLFHRSLLENIRYGRPDATDEMVISAAKKANAHAFIEALPDGYQTLVGDRGAKLSGGQRQRVVIARAILKNAPILIMDEATSQLDSQSEGLIQESLWRLMEKKTSIVIAHRLSTLLHMDRILVFDGGMIVEDGTHQQLLSKGGCYQSLWDKQVHGFLPTDD